MKIQIDLKSAVLGLILGVAAMFALGADSDSQNQIGRYQIQVGNNQNVLAVLVDTATGKVWSAAGTAANQLRNDATFFDAKQK
jgi:hypothetical protein